MCISCVNQIYINNLQNRSYNEVMVKDKNYVLIHYHYFVFMVDKLIVFLPVFNWRVPCKYSTEHTP